MNQESSRSFKNNNWNVQQKSPRNSHSPRLDVNAKKDNNGFKKKKRSKKQGEQPLSKRNKSNGNNDSDDDIKMINQSMVQLEDPKFIEQQIDSFEQNLSRNIRNKKSLGFCQETRQKSLLLCNTQGYRRYKNDIKNGKQKLSHSNSKDSQNVNTKNIYMIKQQKNDTSKNENGQVSQNEQRKAKDEQNKSSTSLAYSNDSRQEMRKKMQKKQQQKNLENNSFASVVTVNNDNISELEGNPKQQKHITKHLSF